MSGDAAFSCQCGKVKGRLRDASPRSGLHIVCFCESCRVADIHAGFEDPAPEPVDLYQIPAHRVVFDAGQDLIAPFKVKPKGVLRWRATCCGTLMGNTPDNAKMPLFALQTRLSQTPSAFGPVRTQAFVPQPDGRAKHEGYLPLAGTVWRMLAAVLTGKWRQSPFFDAATRAPIKAAQVMSKEERAAIIASFN